MDILDLALSKSYTNNKVLEGGAGIQVDWNQNDSTANDYIKNRIAYTEPAKPYTLTFDGKLEGKEYIPGDALGVDGSYSYVKISDTPLSLNSFKEMQIKNLDKISKEQLFIEQELSSWAARIDNKDSVPLILSIAENLSLGDQVDHGTYVGYLNQNVYVTAVYCETEEKIHQIDPKYYERLGWTEKDNQIILPEATILLVNALYYFEKPLNLIENFQYIVSLNGTEYKTISKFVSMGDSAWVNYIGNGALIDLEEEDTGEPFIILDGSEDGIRVSALTTTIDDEQVTLAISGEVEKIHKVDSKFIHTPDMEASKGEHGYIKNRPIYTEPSRVVLPEETFILQTGEIDGLVPLGLVANKNYIVNLSGIDYKVKCYTYSLEHEGITYTIKNIGNVKFDPDFPGDKIDTGEPFLISEFSFYPGWVGTLDQITGDVTISIIEEEFVHKLDSKYLPDAVPNIPSAKVGQLISVKAVNEQGQPTDWEAVDCLINEDNIKIMLKILDSAAYISDQSDNIVALKQSLKEVAIVKLINGTTSFVEGAGLQIHRIDKEYRATLMPIGQYLKPNKTYRFSIGEASSAYAYGVQIMQASGDGLKFDCADGTVVYYNTVTSRLMDTGWITEDYEYTVTGDNQIFTMNFKVIANNPFTESDFKTLLENIMIEEVL